MTDRDKRLPERTDNLVRDIRRATRRKFSSEEKIRIVLEGLRGEETIAELCILVTVCDLDRLIDIAEGYDA